MRLPILIRPLTPEDAGATGRIFFCAVHEGTCSAYDERQRCAWAGETFDPDRWRVRVQGLTGFVAEADGEPIGFMTIDRSGYVDLAFVRPSASRKGVGRALLQAAEDWAKAQGAVRMTTEASLIAGPFFQQSGWQVIEREEVERGGVMLARYRMQKHLL